MTKESLVIELWGRGLKSRQINRLVGLPSDSNYPYVVKNRWRKTRAAKRSRGNGRRAAA